MQRKVLRRAAGLAAILTLAITSLAMADTVVADGDAVAPGIQGTAALGAVAPGAVLHVDVPFTLACKGTSHAAAGSTIAVVADTLVVPSDGALVATAGSIGPLPTTWPAPGTSCPGTLTPSLVSAVPAHVTITAPTAPGTGYGYTILFVRDPEDGLSSMTAVSFTLDVVEPAAADTTPPVLAAVPADLTVETLDPAGATVTWADPTATDDTDPAPVVACVPAPGSTFPVGSTAVTCTASDASGNTASASFTVTVVLVPQLAARWGSPLGGPHPPVAGPHGRVVPVTVAITADGRPWAPSSGPAPELRLERLSACGGATSAAVTATVPLGAMHWRDGRWMRLVDTRLLAAGCWQVSVAVRGFDAGHAGFVVAGGPAGRLVAGLRRR